MNDFDSDDSVRDPDYTVDVNDADDEELRGNSKKT